MTRQTKISFILAFATFFLSSGSVFAGPFGLFKRCQPNTRNCGSSAPCPRCCEPVDQELWIATAAGTNFLGYSCYATSDALPTAAQAVSQAAARATNSGCTNVTHVHTQQVYGSMMLVCSHPSSADMAALKGSPELSTLWVADAYGTNNGYSCNASSKPFEDVSDAVADALSKADAINCDVSNVHTRQVQGIGAVASNGSCCSGHAACFQATFRIWCCGGGVIEGTVKCNDLGIVQNLSRAIACEKATACGCRIRCSRMYCTRLPVGEPCCSNE